MRPLVHDPTNTVSTGTSRIGVPGLFEAIRSDGVAVENMPGTGFIESRAMLAFLPALALGNVRAVGGASSRASSGDL